MSLARSPFTNIPVEYTIPKATKIVFVNDFFVREVAGGAELTSEALIQAYPGSKKDIFKLHSKSLTRKLLEQNKDKYWIFGNFATMDSHMSSLIPKLGIRYSIVEYDFKFCEFRSPNLHLLRTGNICSCSANSHGLDIGLFFSSAEHIFWMSKKQEEVWLKNVPGLSDQKNRVVLSSIFTEETFQFLSTLRKSRTAIKDKWAVLGSGSWLKGVEETQKWCSMKRLKHEKVPALPYADFLKKLSEYKGLVFRPLEFDTCPRLVLEAKLLGLDLILNKNVLHKDEEWFLTQSLEECIVYLKERPAFFWKSLSS